MLFAPVQRISASSTKSISKLSAASRTRAKRPVAAVSCGAAIPAAVSATPVTRGGAYCLRATAARQSEQPSRGGGLVGRRRDATQAAASSEGRLKLGYPEKGE